MKEIIGGEIIRNGDYEKEGRWCDGVWCMRGWGMVGECMEEVNYVFVIG